MTRNSSPFASYSAIRAMASVHSEFVKFVRSGHLSASCSLGFPRTLKISIGASRLSTTVVPVG
ncbi:MAG: hypothetical protein ACK56F_32625, partial [bacterium]